MNQHRLDVARELLQVRQRELHDARTHRVKAPRFIRYATENFYAALDHLWEVQCMAQPNL